MKKTIGTSMRTLFSLALVLPMLLMGPAAHAADAGDKGESGEIDSKATANQQAATDTVESKIERLGRIKRFRIIDLRATQRDGLMMIQASLQNGRKSQDIVYRARWLDKDGFNVWDDEPWKPLSLYDHQKQNLVFVAPTPKAVDFRLQFQGERGHEKAHEKSRLK